MPHLIAELTENPHEEQLRSRLASFRETRARPAGVVDATLELMSSDNPKVRAATIRAIAYWHAPEPALLQQVRIALDDPSPDVRKAVAAFFNRHADAAPDH